MKTVKEILKEYRFGKHDRKTGLRLETMDIDQAIREIDAIYKSKVPKKKGFLPASDFNNLSDIEYSQKVDRCIGYNLAIADLHKEEEI